MLATDHQHWDHSSLDTGRALSAVVRHALSPLPSKKKSKADDQRSLGRGGRVNCLIDAV